MALAGMLQRLDVGRGPGLGQGCGATLVSSALTASGYGPAPLQRGGLRSGCLRGRIRPRRAGTVLGPGFLILAPAVWPVNTVCLKYCAVSGFNKGRQGPSWAVPNRSGERRSSRWRGGGAASPPQCQGLPRASRHQTQPHAGLTENVYCPKMSEYVTELPPTGGFAPGWKWGSSSPAGPRAQRSLSGGHCCRWFGPDTGWRSGQQTRSVEMK